jgi:predicted Zn-dependent protease
MEKNYIEDEGLLMNYVNGQLTGQDLSDFENALRQSPLLAEEVLLRKQIARVVRNPEAVKAMQNIQNWLEAKPMPALSRWEKGYYRCFRYRYWIGSFAMIFALGIGSYGYHYQKQLKLTQLSVQYFQHYVSHSSTVVANAQLQSGLTAYNNKQYKGATDSLQAYLRKHPYDMEIQLYLGISYLATDNFAQAIRQLSVFESVIQKDDFKYLEPAGRWYLALAHLRNADKATAIPLLRSIPTSEAQALLKSLE